MLALNSDIIYNLSKAFVGITVSSVIFYSVSLIVWGTSGGVSVRGLGDPYVAAGRLFLYKAPGLDAPRAWAPRLNHAFTVAEKVAEVK